MAIKTKKVYLLKLYFLGHERAIGIYTSHADAVGTIYYMLQEQNKYYKETKNYNCGLTLPHGYDDEDYFPIYNCVANEEIGHFTITKTAVKELTIKADEWPNDFFASLLELQSDPTASINF